MVVYIKSKNAILPPSGTEVETELSRGWPFTVSVFRIPFTVYYHVSFTPNSSVDDTELWKTRMQNILANYETKAGGVSGAISSVTTPIKSTLIIVAVAAIVILLAWIKFKKEI